MTANKNTETIIFHLKRDYFSKRWNSFTPSLNSKITRSAQVATGAFAPVFALPTSWGPDVRQFGKFKGRTPERAADKLSARTGGQLRVIQNVMRNARPRYSVRIKELKVSGK